MATYSSPTDALMAYNGYSENNAEQNAAIAAFIKQNAGFNINPASTAWCAAVLNAALGASGEQGTGKLNARSFLNWGVAVDQPQAGDVVVFSRGPAGSGLGHTGIFLGTNPDGTIRVLSGNHADAVGIDNFSTSNLLGYRRADPNAAIAALSGNATDPISAYAAVQVADGNAYKVRGGDTLGRIAQATGISARDLASYNGIENMDRITAGQTLKLPPNSASAANASFEAGASIHSADPFALAMQGLKGTSSTPPIPVLPPLVPNTQIGTPPGTQLGLTSNSPPPVPRPRPSSIVPTGMLPATSTGTTYHLGDLVRTADGTHMARVEDDGTGHAKFVRQLNPGEAPGAFDPYQAVGQNARPSLIGNYINSHPEITGPLQMAKAMGLTADQAAQLAANPPKFTLPSFAPGQPLPNSSGSPDDRDYKDLVQSVRSGAGNAMAAFSQAAADPGAALGGLTSLIPSFLRAPSGQPTSPPATSIVPKPVGSTNGGWSDAWSAAPLPVVPRPSAPAARTPAQVAAIRAVPQTAYYPKPLAAPATPSAVPSVASLPTPALAPGLTAAQKYAMSALPSSSYMPPTLLPNDAAAMGVTIPSLPPDVAPVTAPQGPVHRRPVNPAPQYVPPPMATIATGKTVPVGTKTPDGGQVQSDGSIVHPGGWVTPGPGQGDRWWQSNNPDFGGGGMATPAAPAPVSAAPATPSQPNMLQQAFNMTPMGHVYQYATGQKASGGLLSLLPALGGGTPSVSGAMASIIPQRVGQSNINHNYAPVTHAGQRYDVMGNDMAFMPTRVQTSSRWNTGY